MLQHKNSRPCLVQRNTIFINAAVFSRLAQPPTRGSVVARVLADRRPGDLPPHVPTVDEDDVKIDASLIDADIDVVVDSASRVGPKEHATMPEVLHAPDIPDAIPSQIEASSEVEDVVSEFSSAQESRPATTGGSNAANRVVFGALMGIGGVAAVLSKQLFVVAAIFIAYHATIEYYSMVTSKGITAGMRPPPALVSSLTTVISVSMVLFSVFSGQRSGTVLAVAAFFLLVMNLVANKKPTFSMLSSTVFGIFYCGWLPSFWVKLRWLPIQAPELPILTGLVLPVTAWTVGLIATFTSAICVVAADTGAYFVGKTVGRTKLTEISPKKTVEGALGGLASSIGAAVAMQQLTSWPATPVAAAGLGVITFFSSLFGDLIQSIIKRDAGMKDSGNMIPGHGGILDRFDSYMFTGAVVYCYIVFGLPLIA